MTTGRSDSPLLFDLVLTVFVATLLISTHSARSYLLQGPWCSLQVSFYFPSAIWLVIFLTECWGFARSRRVIWLGFLAEVLMATMYWLGAIVPPSPDWPGQDAYQMILGVVPRIAAASLLAYWAGEFVNSYVLARMKIWTRGRYLWTRTIGSTVVGQAIDTAVFTIVAFTASNQPTFYFRFRCRCICLR